MSNAFYKEKVWEAFGDRVGWRVGGSWLDYKDLKFNQTAPVGHLPTMFCGGSFWSGWRTATGLEIWCGGFWLPLLSRRDL